MYIQCIYMFEIVCKMVNLYIHVCTSMMFRDVCTVLPIFVQVVRIPDGSLFPWHNCHGDAWNKTLLITHTRVPVRIE